MADHQRFNIKSIEELRQLARQLAVDIPVSEDIDILLEPKEVDGKIVPNRMVVQPMEGFDSNPDGSPGELTFRRYERYAQGGSGMIWFEATSVMQEGRSNPRQLMLTNKTLDGFKRLVEKTKESDSYLVLQLTHSGRYSKPEGKPTGRYFIKHKYLDPHETCSTLITDDQIEIIRDKYCEAITLAEKAGFDSVDLKISHGYLLHEILLSYNRDDSRFGGSFDNRMSFIQDLVDYPTKLCRSIRLNATDMIPYPHGFGMSKGGSMEIDLSETKRLIRSLEKKVPLWNITAGIPYYNPFVNRPYDKGLMGTVNPPEHPLEGVVRMINITGELQQEFPDLPMVGSAYSWLRQFFPNVGAGVLKSGKATFIGLGRSSFAYPDATKDLIIKRALDPKKVCVTCSMCTQFMRNGVPSGCAIRDKELYRSSR